MEGGRDELLRVLSDEWTGDECGPWRLEYVLYRVVSDGAVSFDLFAGHVAADAGPICSGSCERSMRALTLRLGKVTG